MLLARAETKPLEFSTLRDGLPCRPSSKLGALLGTRANCIEIRNPRRRPP